MPQGVCHCKKFENHYTRSADYRVSMFQVLWTYFIDSLTSVNEEIKVNISWGISVVL